MIPCRKRFAELGLQGLSLFALGIVGLLGNMLAVPALAQVPNVIRMELRLPISSAAEERMLRQLQELADQPSAGQRPIVILDFVAARASDPEKRQEDLSRTVGSGTQFERALRIARWLTGPDGVRVKSIAYFRKPVAGHAVLIALACEEIAMGPDATLGNAALDERVLDTTVRQAYMDIRAKREQIPEAVVAAMLDPQKEVYRVQLVDGGEQFIDKASLEKLREEGKFWSEDQITFSGTPVELSATVMKRYRWISHMVMEHQDLVSELELPAIPRWSSAEGESWRPVVIYVHGKIHARQINRLMRALDEAISKDRANLLLLDIDSAGGSLHDSLRFAHQISSFGPEALETVALISGEARGDASILAMACRSVYMRPDGRLGGEGEASITSEQIMELYPSFETLAQNVGRSPGELIGPVTSVVETYRYTNPKGMVRWDIPARVPEKGGWVQSTKLEVGDGLLTDTLLKEHWIRGFQSDLESIAEIYGLEDLPEPRRANRVEAFVQSLANISWLPFTLVLLGFVLFMVEITTPGVTLPGLLSAICFGLFFWIRFLDGTVEWLEILLFCGGTLLLLIELFVLPGFGVFGISGLLMLVIAILLASQTFIWPSNNYQLNEMAWNLGQMAGVLSGILITMFLMRNQLDNLPMFRWLRLTPMPAELAAELEEREAVVHWDHFLGKVGITVTRCNPAGKVKIGSEVVNVISTGELLPEDQSVRVVEVRGNTVVVAKLD